jgi:hypothetical protein
VGACSTHLVELHDVHTNTVARSPPAQTGGISANSCITAAHFVQFGRTNIFTG